MIDRMTHTPCRCPVCRSSERVRQATNRATVALMIWFTVTIIPGVVFIGPKHPEWATPFSLAVVVPAFVVGFIYIWKSS